MCSTLFFILNSSLRLHLIECNLILGFEIWTKGWECSFPYFFSHFSQKSKFGQIAHLYLHPINGKTPHPSQVTPLCIILSQMGLCALNFLSGFLEIAFSIDKKRCLCSSFFFKWQFSQKSKSLHSLQWYLIPFIGAIPHPSQI